MISKTFFYFVLLPALLPVFIILRYILKKDRMEREPIGMILLVLIMGAIFAIPCSFLETAAASIIGGIYDINTIQYAWKEMFWGVAIIEEMSKWAVLMIFVWRNKNFNYRYDGIVYAVCASLGFAGIENVLYIIRFGTAVSVPRAIFSIPGHTTFGVFMGYYLSRAKHHKVLGHMVRAIICWILSVFVPAFVHGVYDFLLTEQAAAADLKSMFIGYVIVLDVWAYFTIRHEFRTDRPLF